MIVHKKTGMLYPSGDTNTAYHMARTLMEDLPLRRQIRRAGMLHIRSRFRPERYVGSFAECLLLARDEIRTFVSRQKDYYFV